MQQELVVRPQVRSGRRPSVGGRRLGGLLLAGASLAAGLVAAAAPPATAAAGTYSRATLSGTEGDALVGPNYTRFDQVSASRSGQTLTATFAAPGQSWTLTVQPEVGQTLSVGRKDLTTKVATAESAGLDLTGVVDGQTRSCAQVHGGYEIRALEDDGGVPSFGLDFYVRCNAIDAPVATGFAAYRLATGPLDEGALQTADLVAVTPTRLYDSRSGDGPFEPAEERSIDVTAGPVPADALAVVLNLTAVFPTEAGYLTAYPAGSERPEASNVNLRPGRAVPNLATVRVGATGDVSIFNSHGQTDVVVDLVGYYAPSGQPGGARFRSRQPSRLLDTRTDGSALQPFQPRVLSVAGAEPNAVAAVLNVTVDQPATAGYVTVYPADMPWPLASNLNYLPGDTVPNLVIVRLSPDQRVKLETDGSTHVIVDLVGTFVADEADPTGRFVPVDPQRLVDTRRPLDGGPLGPDNVREFGLAGLLHRYGSEVSGVLFNTTVSDTTGHSFLTVWPSGQPWPLASNLNWGPGIVRANLVAMGTDPYGFASFYNLAGSASLILDAAGWFTA